MSQLVFIGIGVSIFLASLLIGKRKKKSFDIILSIWLIVSGVQLSFFYWSMELDLTNIPQTILFPIALLPYLTAPILFFYVSALIGKKPFHLKQYWFHLLPYSVLLFSFYYVLCFEENTNVYVENAVIFIDGDLPLHMRHHGWSMAFIYILYPIWSLFLLHRHKKEIDFQFSFPFIPYAEAFL